MARVVRVAASGQSCLFLGEKTGGLPVCSCGFGLLVGLFNEFCMVLLSFGSYSLFLETRKTTATRVLWWRSVSVLLP